VCFVFLLVVESFGYSTSAVNYLGRYNIVIERNLSSANSLSQSLYCARLRLLSNYFPTDGVVCVQNLDEWSFNVFSVNEAATDGHTLKYIGYEIIQKYNLINKFRVRSPN